MRKLALTFALAGAALALPFVPAQAGAILPAPLGAAIDETALVQSVHCWPGWLHHSSFRYPDGCEPPRYRRYRYYDYGHERYYYRRHPHAYYYGPGVTFGFSVGPRRHWHW